MCLVVPTSVFLKWTRCMHLRDHVRDGGPHVLGLAEEPLGLVAQALAEAFLR